MFTAALTVDKRNQDQPVWRRKSERGEKATLDNLAVFQRGFDITKDQQMDGLIPIISSSGISSFHNQAKCKAPGVVTGRKGTLGKVFFSKINYWPHDTTLWVKDFKNNSPPYIYYFLQLLKLETYDVGASNPTLNRNHIHKLKITIPPLPIQRKIAAVLSAYDDLIENNNRRIAILEKMAEELYREWFVRLRFPGHESVKIVQGVPEGWEVKRIGDLAQYINGYPFAPEDWKSEGLPIIKIKELKQGVTTETPRNSGELVPKKLHISNGDILFSWSGSLEVVFWNGGDG